LKRPHKFAIGIIVIVASVGFLIYAAVDQTKMYMLTVGEYVGSKTAYAGKTVRIAGRVGESSMQWDAGKRELRFTLDDITGEDSIRVQYTGLLPDMFAEGRDVIIEGPDSRSNDFRATTILTSCPSKYEPE
jgi:cytochrome c-type biogenesis protein CcmE